MSETEQILINPKILLPLSADALGHQTSRFGVLKPAITKKRVASLVCLKIGEEFFTHPPLFKLIESNIDEPVPVKIIFTDGFFHIIQWDHGKEQPVKPGFSLKGLPWTNRPLS